VGRAVGTLRMAERTDSALGGGAEDGRWRFRRSDLVIAATLLGSRGLPRLARRLGAGLRPDCRDCARGRVARRRRGSRGYSTPERSVTRSCLTRERQPARIPRAMLAA
jgi:hypothetical protein